MIFNHSRANVDLKREQSPAAVLKNGVPNIVVNIPERQRVHVNQIRSDQISSDQIKPDFFSFLTAIRFRCELIACNPFESLMAPEFVVSFLQLVPDRLITRVDTSKITGLR